MHSPGEMSDDSLNVLQLAHERLQITSCHVLHDADHRLIDGGHTYHFDNVRMFEIPCKSKSAVNGRFNSICGPYLVP